MDARGVTPGSSSVPAWFARADALLRSIQEPPATVLADQVTLGSTAAPPSRPAAASAPAAIPDAAPAASSVRIQVQQGDLARVPADAMITAVNSEGMWFGGIDGVIQRAAGGQFHSQAQAAMPLADGQTVVARGTGAPNHGAFKNVVFVVDDLNKPLRQVIKAGLEAADGAGFQSVSLPAVRMGVMLGVVEKSSKQAAEEMAAGIKEFMAENPAHLKDITFVVYNDPTTASLLQQATSVWQPL